MSARVVKLKQRQIARAREEHAAPAIRLGKLVGRDGRHRVLVECSGSPAPQSAQLGIAADAVAIERAIANEQTVVLAFAEGERTPIVIGLLGEFEPAGAFAVEADADGRRVRVAAQEEISFECGAASVTLKRDGRVVIRGTYVETCAAGTNRIKGGHVRIN